MPVGPAVQTQLLRLGAHRLVGDLRHVDAAGAFINAPHAFFFERQLFLVARHQDGFQKKPAVVGNLAFIVQALFHRPVILPAVGEMNVVDDFASDHFHQGILHLLQLIAAKNVAVIVQPFAPAFDGAQANFADNSHGAGGESEKPSRSGR